jgi:hypothetical protein
MSDDSSAVSSGRLRPSPSPVSSQTHRHVEQPRDHRQLVGARLAQVVFPGFQGLELDAQPLGQLGLRHARRLARGGKTVAKGRRIGVEPAFVARSWSILSGPLAGASLQPGGFAL